MGKKERTIKKLNKDFYKEYNNENNEQLIKEEEFNFEKQRLLAEKQEHDNNKLHNVAYGIMRDMRDYSDSQGLCLCETLDYINVDNFMDYIMKQPIYKEPKQEPSRVVADMIRPLEKLVQSVKDLENDIAAIELDIAKRRREYITEAGEDMLFRNYIHDNFNGEIPGDMKIGKTRALLFKKLKKIAGSPEKYNALVNDFGEAQYAHSVGKLGL